jgi:hypothetical protein
MEGKSFQSGGHPVESAGINQVRSCIVGHPVVDKQKRVDAMCRLVLKTVQSHLRSAEVNASEALPSRSRDFSLSRQNAKGRPSRPALRPLCRRSGHSPALPYPPHSVVKATAFPRSSNKSLHRAHSRVITTLVLNPLLRWPVLK